jgi:hypothetical protein
MCGACVFREVVRSDTSVRAWFLLQLLRDWVVSNCADDFTDTSLVTTTGHVICDCDADVSAMEDEAASASLRDHGITGNCVVVMKKR